MIKTSSNFTDAMQKTSSADPDEFLFTYILFILLHNVRLLLALSVLNVTHVKYLNNRIHMC